MEIKHLAGCPAKRIETFKLDAATGKWEVSRCGDCGAQTERQLAPPRPIDSEGLAPSAVGGPIYTSAGQPQVEATMRKVEDSHVR